MKKFIKILGTIILLCIVSFGLYYMFKTNPDIDLAYKNPDMVWTMKAVVVRVHEKSLSVMGIDNTNDLYSVSFADEGNIGFKQGQEILIYSNGMIADSYPAQIHHVGKIEIIKEKSNISIPESVLKFFYSSRNNVVVNISKLTTTGISLTIIDNNEFQYDYSNEYRLDKNNKQAESNNAKPTMLQLATSNTTSAYMGSGQVLWQEAKKVSNISVESTVKTYVNSTTNTIEKTCDWTNVYGQLDERSICIYVISR